MALELDFSNLPGIESVIHEPGYINPLDRLRADPNRPSGRDRPQGGGARWPLVRDPKWIVGLDLGQAHDFTAVVAAEIIRPVPPGERPHLTVPLVSRAPLGTPYPAIVARITDLLTTPPFQGATHLVVDSTGVGRPVLDLLRAGPLQPIPVTITGGDTVNGNRFMYRVPKRDLVFSAQLALQQGRLRIAAESEQAETLARELADFRVRITAGGSDQYGVWREGQHDDLVLALALAVWWAEWQTCRRAPGQLP